MLLSRKRVCPAVHCLVPLVMATFLFLCVFFVFQQSQPSMRNAWVSNTLCRCDSFPYFRFQVPTAHYTVVQLVNPPFLHLSSSLGASRVWFCVMVKAMLRSSFFFFCVCLAALLRSQQGTPVRRAAVEENIGFRSRGRKGGSFTACGARLLASSVTSAWGSGEIAVGSLGTF